MSIKKLGDMFDDKNIKHIIFYTDKNIGVICNYV